MYKIPLLPLRIFGFCFLFALFPYSPSSAQEPSGNPEFRKIIVKFKDGYAHKKQRHLSLGGKGNKIITALQNLDLEVWDLGENLQVGKRTFFSQEALLSYLNAQPEIAYAVPDHKVYLAETEPNDPHFSKQWALQNTGQNVCPEGNSTHATQVWDIQKDCGEVVIGIIDSGIDWTHEDLVDNIWQNLAEDADGDGHTLEKIGNEWVLDPGDLNGMDEDGNGYPDDLIGWDFVNDDNNPMDDEGHGTHVAGIIGAKSNNSVGVAGICWESQLLALKGLNEQGTGFVSILLKALDYALEKGVKISNNSWTLLGNDNRALYEAIQTAEKAGHLFVAASGNNSQNIDQDLVYPASYDLPNILTVSASNCKDQPIELTNYGIQSVDIFAPGEGIFSTALNQQYEYKSGTSMAAPFVTGAAALILQANPQFTYEALKGKIVLNTREAPNLTGKCKTNGVLDMVAAFEGGFLFDEEGSPWEGFLSFNPSSNIIEFRDQIWIGNEGGGLTKIDKKGGNPEFSNSISSIIPTNSLTGMYANDSSLWIGTAILGACQFDGSGWKTFPFFSENSLFRYISSIDEDTLGNIWALAGNNRLRKSSLVRFDGEIWQTFEEVFGITSPGPYTSTNSLAIDHNNNIWYPVSLDTLNVYSYKGLAYFNQGTLKWRILTSSNSNLPQGRIVKLDVSDDGKIWVSTSQGFATIELKGDSVVISNSVMKNLYSSPLGDFTFSKDGSVWFSTSVGVIQVKNDSIVNNLNSNNSVIKENRIVAILEDNEGILWVVPAIQNFEEQIIYRIEGDEISRLSVTLNFKGGAHIADIQKDTEGGIWILGAHFGLMEFTKNKWIYHSNNTLDSSRFSSNSFPKSIAFDSLGNYWVAAGKNLYKCKENDCEWFDLNNVIEFDSTEFPLYTYHIIVSSDNVIWIGTNKGLIRYDNEWTVYDTSSVSVFKDQTIWEVFEDMEGNIWACIWLDLYRYDQVLDEWFLDPSRLYTDLEMDNNGVLWGVGDSRIAYRDDTVWVFPEWLESVDLPHINAFTIDQENNLWLGSGNGFITRIDTIQNITIWSVTNSPLSGGIQELEVDNRGYIWAGGGRDGLIIINPNNLASFSISNRNICVNETITFTNFSFVTDSSTWRINNNLVSTEKDLTYSFDTPGSYEITTFGHFQMGGTFQVCLPNLLR